MSKLETGVFENAVRLISTMGQFHWRGTDVLATRSYSDGKRFHYNEDGDATFHTAMLLTALSFRYKEYPEETYPVILDLLDYFELMFKYNNGLGRCFVDKKAYNVFPPQEKHGTATMSLDDEAGGHMRYIDAQNGMMVRYDISPDPVLMTSVALYWCSVNLWNTHAKIKSLELASKLKDWLSRAGHAIRDKETGDILRYGIHHPKFYNPIPAATNAIVMATLFGGRPTTGVFWVEWFANRMRTWLPGLWRSKKTRNAFNNLIFLMAYSTMYHAGYKVRRGLRRMIKETSGELNMLALGINSRFIGPGIPVADFMKEDFPIQSSHPVGKLILDEAVPLAQRVGYNKWEVNPYETFFKSVPTVDGKPLGNGDYLLAYWYGRGL